MRILISGAGIAGPTLAYWLARHGFTPTLVEKSPVFRRGGYVIDFWGTGFDVADKMGLVPDLMRLGYRVREVRVVGRDGKRTSGFPVSAMLGALGDRFVSIPRGDLAGAIYGRIDGKVETIFGDGIRSLQDDGDRVRVGFEKGPDRDFDLVLGADGLHSRVRELAFGPQARYEKYLGYKVAAFEAEGYPNRDELVYVMYTEVGQMAGRFTLRGGRTLFMFILADDDPGGPQERTLEGQKALLRRRFSKGGWECGAILDRMDASSELYFDRVSQIRMRPEEGLWSRGRVGLLGDAAFCVSLLAGQGSALAMAAAYTLAGELKRAGGDHRTAFQRYQELFGPFVAGKQQAAVKFAGAFAPKTRAGLVFRNQVMKMLNIPWVARQAFQRDLSDKILLPDFG